MPNRPFFVQRNGDCVPLEGEWRVECLEGDWYVLGHHSVVPCPTEHAARATCADLSSRNDANRLAIEAIEGLGLVFPAQDSDVFSEADLG
jgi:hypothetical protein